MSADGLGDEDDGNVLAQREGLERRNDVVVLRLCTSTDELPRAMGQHRAEGSESRSTRKGWGRGEEQQNAAIARRSDSSVLLTLSHDEEVGCVLLIAVSDSSEQESSHSVLHASIDSEQAATTGGRHTATRGRTASGGSVSEQRTGGGAVPELCQKRAHPWRADECSYMRPAAAHLISDDGHCRQRRRQAGRQADSGGRCERQSVANALALALRPRVRLLSSSSLLNAPSPPGPLEKSGALAMLSAVCCLLEGGEGVARVAEG